MFNNKYNIGDYVYHNTPDSQKGLIIDVKYSFKNENFRYLVAVGFENEYDCDEDEITKDKVF